VTLHPEPGRSITRDIAQRYGGGLRRGHLLQRDGFRAGANFHQAPAGQISSCRLLTMQCNAVKTHLKKAVDESAGIW